MPPLDDAAKMPLPMLIFAFVDELPHTYAIRFFAAAAAMTP